MTWRGGFSNPVATILPGSVGSTELADGAVTTPKLGDAAVIETKLANLSVAAAKLQDEAVTNAKLGNDAVSTIKVQDLAIVTAKIGLLAVGAAQIKDLAVTAAKIANATITDAKIASLNADKITAGTITARTYRTAASGARLEIDGAASEDFIRFYTGAGSLRGTMGVSSNGAEIGIFGETAAATNLRMESGFGINDRQYISVRGDLNHIALGVESTDILRIGQTSGASTRSGIFAMTPLQTGQATYTREPWDAGSIMLGAFGSIGSQGNFTTWLSWNFERGTDSGWYHLNAGGLPDAGAVEVARNGIQFRYDAAYAATTAPLIRATINEDGIHFNQDSDTMLGGAGANQLEATAGGLSVWLLGTSGFHTNFRHELGNTSGLFIGSDMTDVGNIAVLRAARIAGGTSTSEVGWFSSDRASKTDIHSLGTKAAQRYWKRDWFRDIETSVSRKKKTTPYFRKLGYDMRIISFMLDNLLQHTNLLTSDGEKAGSEPDLQAILAVTVDYLQHVDDRLMELEKAA